MSRIPYQFRSGRFVHGRTDTEASNQSARVHLSCARDSTLKSVWDFPSGGGGAQWGFSLSACGSTDKAWSKTTKFHSSSVARLDPSKYMYEMYITNWTRLYRNHKKCMLVIGVTFHQTLRIALPVSIMSMTNTFALHLVFDKCYWSANPVDDSLIRLMLWIAIGQSYHHCWIRFSCLSWFYSIFCITSSLQFSTWLINKNITNLSNVSSKRIVLVSKRAGLRFYKIRFYKIQHNSIQHNCVYVVVYVCRNACVWVFYLIETNLVETKACRQKEDNDCWFFYFFRWSPITNHKFDSNRNKANIFIQHTFW